MPPVLEFADVAAIRRAACAALGPGQQLTPAEAAEATLNNAAVRSKRLVALADTSPRHLSTNITGNNSATVSFDATNPAYSAAIRAWRRLPLGIANLISPMISRSLG